MIDDDDIPTWREAVVSFLALLVTFVCLGVVAAVIWAILDHVTMDGGVNQR